MFLVRRGSTEQIVHRQKTLSISSLGVMLCIRVVLENLIFLGFYLGFDHRPLSGSHRDHKSYKYAPRASHTATLPDSNKDDTRTISLLHHGS